MGVFQRLLERKNHLELIVSASIKDICNDCCVFANQHRYCVHRQEERARREEETDGTVLQQDDEGVDDEVEDMMESETLITNAA
jgi:hypothetical protein